MPRINPGTPRIEDYPSYAEPEISGWGSPSKTGVTIATMWIRKPKAFEIPEREATPEAPPAPSARVPRDPDGGLRAEERGTDGKTLRPTRRFNGYGEWLFTPAKRFGRV
jgi:hypothetical protein